MRNLLLNFSMKKWMMIIIGSLILMLLVFVVGKWIYLKTSTKQEVYILPQGFKGVVVIAYDQKDGLKDEIEDNKIIYKVPESGVLKLKRKSTAMLSQSWYYFEDAQGKRSEFYYCFPPCEEMKRNPLNVYTYGASTGTLIGDSGYQLHRTVFLVGSFHDVDSLNIAVEKLNPLELIKNSK